MFNSIKKPQGGCTGGSFNVLALGINPYPVSQRSIKRRLFMRGHDNVTSAD
jgi:hypothetical protein